MSANWLVAKTRLIQSFLTKPGVDDLLTPFPEALIELEKRCKDEVLKRRVAEYLKKDIPDHFLKGPVLYLARHIATPNFETLRFLHLVEPVGIPAVIGQDVKDLFVPANQLKRALAKLSLSTGIRRQENGYYEQYQNLTIVDFNVQSGKPFHEVQTLWGEALTDFHTGLFPHLTTTPVYIADDSEWITRHHRGDLLQHYKHFLALFVTHGILFEDYLVGDRAEDQFIATILRPAFKFVEKRFGVRPLITNLTPTSVESARFWLSYPETVRTLASEKLRQSNRVLP